MDFKDTLAGAYLETNDAHTIGAGQSVNVVISGGSVKWLVMALVALLGLMLITQRTASEAKMKSEAAAAAAYTASSEYRMAQFWMQSSKVSCDAHGVNLPPLPAAFK